VVDVVVTEDKAVSETVAVFVKVCEVKLTAVAVGCTRTVLVEMCKNFEQNTVAWRTDKISSTTLTAGMVQKLGDRSSRTPALRGN